MIEKNVIQSKIDCRFNVSVKEQNNIVCAKKIMFRILAYQLVSVTKVKRLVDIQKIVHA